MTYPAHESSELRRLLTALLDGQIGDDEARRLEQIITDDAEARRVYRRYLELHVMLQFEQRQPRTPAAPSESAEAVLEYIRQASSQLLRHGERATPAAPLASTPIAPPAEEVSPSAILGQPHDGFGGHIVQSLGQWFRLPGLVLLLMAALVGGTLSWWLMPRDRADVWLPAGSSLAGAPAHNLDVVSPAGQPFVATLVNVTNCRWDKARSTVDLVEGGLRPGQSLHLLEGVATISSRLPSGSVGKFQLEGPLAMTLADDGMPNLLYGKLAGEFEYHRDSFSMGTALGRIVVGGDASLGIRAAANEVELHVFRGEANFDVWSTGFDEMPSQLLTAEPGTSLRARVAADGRISVDYGKALENRFVTPASLAASQLLISDEYVKTIRDAKPVGYWRFEEEVDGRVRNEMSDRFSLRMGGDAVRLRSGQGTRSAEFGITAGPGYMMSDDVFDGVINKDYTLEVWAKPTCFHHGVMFSLIDWNPLVSPRGRHRLHLELCGPRPGDYKQSAGVWDSHPGRICFINRRAESFSSSPYTVRKWQHFVAVRDNWVMRLYADGRLVATDENTEPLGDGMRVLMGQLYPPSEFVNDEVTARLFVGEVDEIVLYDRPLKEAEIQQHLRLARPDLESTVEASRDF